MNTKLDDILNDDIERFNDFEFAPAIYSHNAMMMGMIRAFRLDGTFNNSVYYEWMDRINQAEENALIRIGAVNYIK